jgi:hypothetical protein
MAVERLSIPVSSTVADALRSLAWREDRDPRRQAERFIREGLIREGALPADDKTALASEPAR